MPYRRQQWIQETEGESPPGLLELWHAQPLPDAFLRTTAPSAARLIFVISTIAYLWAMPRNLGVANGLIATQVGFLTVLALLSLQRIPVTGRVRLALLCGLIVVMGATAHERNQNVLAALFSTFPIATLLIISFGTRITLVVMTGIHGLAGLQAVNIGAQDLATISVYISISFLWSIMVASFVTLLLARIERDFNLISRLLDQERSTLRVITNELRVPAITLSTLAQHADLSLEDRHNMRDAAEQMILVIDNLRSGSDAEAMRSVRLERFEIQQLVRVMGTQLAPIMKRMEIELITDVEPMAQQIVSADRFRLRAILVNLIRMTATFSDGYRVWLNVSVQDVTGRSAKFYFDVETNGHPRPKEQLAPEMSHKDVSSVEVGEAPATGLWVAHFWTQQLGGELSLFDSPRGGNGFRVAVDLSILSDQNGAGIDAQTEPQTQGWEGMAAVLMDMDAGSTHNVARALSELGLTIIDCQYDADCIERIRTIQPELVLFSIRDAAGSVLSSLHELRHSGSSVPMIAIVGDSSGNSSAKLLDAGADLVLFHPLKPHDMDSALQSLVNMGRLRRKH